MASTNDPAAEPNPELSSAEATATKTPAEAASSAAPPARPRRAPVTPEQVAGSMRRLDALLIPVVIVLAFFLASFAARNSDVFLHLATGRALLNGSYTFGIDPFAFTTEGIRWVNHSWLYDVASYGLYSLGGGPALVAVKAVLIAVLAGLMLSIRRSGQSLWIPAVCVSVALLAMGQRLLLHPSTLSCVFLGVTLWLLTRPAQMETSEPGSRRRPVLPRPRRSLWLLPAVFALWVNTDSWFVLGPVTVALYLVGEVLQGWFSPVSEGADQKAPGEIRTLALVLLAGVAACLLNPHHVYAFRLPSQLSESGAAALLHGDSYFRYYFWSASDYYADELSRSAVGFAYLVLLGLGLISFVVNIRGWRGWRILVWLAFAGLSLSHVRAVSFFAVVGGPIAALNFQDAVARAFGLAPRVSPGWRQWSVGGRLATIFLGLLLVALAWPGWLHATIARGDVASRHVAWGIEQEPSLTKVSQQIHQWHQDGLLGKEDRGLNLTPDLAHYCAWFAPGTRSFLDNRIELFEAAAQDFKSAQEALRLDPEFSGNITTKLEPLTTVLRRHGINYLLLYTTDLNRFRDVFLQLENDPSRQWTLVYRDGRTSIFAWADPEQKVAASRLPQAKVDEAHRAFGPSSEPPLMARPPSPQPPSWYDAFLHPRRPEPLAADEAAMELLIFQANQPRTQRQGLENWLATQAAGTAGSACTAPVLGEPFFRAYLTDAFLYRTHPNLYGKLTAPRFRTDFLAMVNTLLDQEYSRVPGSMASPLLAVRACRRALLDNPEDPDAWYRLQRAYGFLLEATREREWAARLPLLSSMRQVQRVNALVQVVTLNPDHEPAQYELAILYHQMGYLDLALKHYSERLRIFQDKGAARYRQQENYKRDLEKLKKEVDDLDRQVKRALNEYEVGQVNRTSIRSRAEFALQKGLGGVARDTLMQSLEEVKNDPNAVPLEFDLMVRTGAIEGELGVRIGLETAEEKAEETGITPNYGRFGRDRFVLPVYEWMQAMVGAASGDYEKADKFLGSIDAMREQVHQEAKQNELFRRALDIVGSTLVQVEPSFAALHQTYLRTLTYEFARLTALSKPLTADIHALRGILALEAGDLPRATEQFQRVLDLNEPVLAPMARYYLDLLAANKS
jgi:tetratricopeptide (TPR) repeat protein